MRPGDTVVMYGCPSTPWEPLPGTIKPLPLNFPDVWEKIGVIEKRLAVIEKEAAERKSLIRFIRSWMKQWRKRIPTAAYEEIDLWLKRKEAPDVAGQA